MGKTRSGRIYGNDRDVAVSANRSDEEANERRLDADTRHFRAIFSDEVWLMILDRVEASEDLITISNASPYFRNLLRNKINLVQFPAVLEQLIKTASENQERNGQAENNLEFRNILEMRTVCKAWKHVVDERLPKENNFDSRPPPVESILEPILGRYEFAITAADDIVPDAEKFMRHFATTHQPAKINPFCTKSVTISRHLEPELENPENLDRAFTAVHNLLTCYGSHISNLELKADDSLGFEDYHRMHQLLQLTPNLRSLNYNVSANFWWNAELEEQFTFPQLASLEELQAVHGPLSIVTKLVDSGKNKLARLKISSNGCGALLAIPLPNLKDLDILYHCWQADFLSLDAPQVTCPLEKLSVVLAHPGFGGLNAPDQVIRLLNRKWGNTLKDLTISFGGYYYSEGICLLSQTPKNWPKLELPHLESLRMAFNQYCSFGFITPTKNTLKFLQLTYCTGRFARFYGGNTETRAVFFSQLDEWVKALRNPVEANLIWETFPELEMLRCKDDGRLFDPSFFGNAMKSYSRAEWLAKQG